MPGQGRLIAGAMSGTSADGVDIALVRITGRGIEMSAELLRFHHRPYDDELRRAIFAIRTGGSAALAELASLGRRISLAYAAAVNEALVGAHLSGADLAAVAAHGQTLYHAPPDTIQWFDPALLAAEVGCAVVSDFRRADCAAGGQGAPLVPFADYVLFRHANIPRAVVNIGGIANVTCLFPGGALGEVRAFDTGPGNCISDELVRRHDPAGPGVDLDGRLALEGTPLTPWMDAFLRHPYFQQAGPKSTDGPNMIAIFLETKKELGLNSFLPDQLATACALTARLIVDALRVFGDRFHGEMIVSGGGTKNQAIMRYLREYLGDDVPIRATDAFGVPGSAKEALAFAMLSVATLDGIPANVPSVTGARRAVVLGSVTPRP